MKDKKECVDFLVKEISDTFRSKRDQVELDVMDKDLFDEVTSLDFEIEKELISKIKEKYPDSQFLSEEFNSETSLADNTWIIDPIDGTCNLTHQTDFFGVQCALYDEGDIQLSVIFLPFIDEVYTAIKGEGAFLNGERISCSSRDAKHALISFGDFSHQDMDIHMKEHSIMQKVSDKVERIRMYGAASIDFAFCACGRLDGNFSFIKNPWDIAPGILLCKEAGMKFYDSDGNPYEFGKSNTIAVFNSEEMKKELLG